MNPDNRMTEDAFLKQLTDWDDKLEKGEVIPDESSIVTNDELLQKKLGKGLAALKLLDGVRKKQFETPTSLQTITSGLAFTQVKYKLPCRFGKFQLLNELGRGGFGVVFLARDRVLDCHVALKMPHAHVLTNDQLRERFLREARVAAGLHHPNIVPVHEAGEIGPVNYIVYSYCHGITLGEWLRVQKDQIPANLAADWIASLAEAVAYAHSKGVLHRDLKPSNILLHDFHSTGSTIVAGKPLTNQFIPRITDFGLAKLEREKQQTATGAILGTPAYMAPEQASGKGAIGPGVDIHALGVLLYEMLIGHPPFRGETDYDTLQLVSKQEALPLRKVRPKLSRDLETICQKCLQKDPNLRYASAADLAMDLRRFMNHEPIKARPISIIERSYRQCRRHPVVTGLAVALTIALIGGITGIIWENYHRGLQADATQALLNKHLDLLRKNVQSAEEMMKDTRTMKEGRERLIASLPYFDGLLREPQNEPTLQLEVARIASQAASIHLSLGEYPKAIARYQQSVDLFEQYQKTRGPNQALILEQAKTLSSMAFTYRQMSKWDHSELIYRQAINNVTKSLNSEPDNADALAFISNTLIYNSVNLYKQNRSDEAEKDMLLAIEQIDKALTINPQDSSILLSQALAFCDYGWHCFDTNRKKKERHAEAERFLRQAQAIRQAQFDENPQSRAIREVLARSHWRIACLCAADKDRVEEAEENYLVSIRMNDQLSADFPGRPGYAHNGAWDRLNLCDLYDAYKTLDPDMAKSEKLFREAIAIRKKCMKEYPTLEMNVMEVSNLQFRLAGILRKKNHLQEADAVYQEGVKFSEELALEQPSNSKSQEQYASRLQTLANVYESDRMLEKAEDAYRRLLKTREQMVERFPGVTAYMRDLDYTYSRLAAVHRNAHRWKDAADLMGRAVMLRKETVDGPEGTPKDRHALANRYLAWGRDLHELGNDQSAMEKFNCSIELHQGLEREGQKMDFQLMDYGHTLMDAGYTIWDQNKKQALGYFRRALPKREALYLSNKSGLHRNMLAKCNYMLFLAYWHGNYDIFSSIKHYCISSLIDPVYCNPPINPNWLINLAWLHVKSQPVRSANAPANR